MVHYSESSAAFAHPLRKAILYVYIPAFALCVAGSCMTRNAFPGVGIVAISLSAFLSITTLGVRRWYQKRRIQLPADDDDGDRDRAPAALSPLAVCIYDVLLATFLMICCLFTWDKGRISREAVRMDTFASVPLLFAHVVHIYLALLALYQAFQHALKREHPSVTCPNCNIRVRTPANSSWFKRGQRRNGPYSAIGDDESFSSPTVEVSTRKNAGIVEPAADESTSKTSDKGKGADEPSISPVDE